MPDGWRYPTFGVSIMIGSIVLLSKYTGEDLAAMYENEYKNYLRLVILDARASD